MKCLTKLKTIDICNCPVLKERCNEESGRNGTRFFIFQILFLETGDGWELGRCIEADCGYMTKDWIFDWKCTFIHLLDILWYYGVKIAMRYHKKGAQLKERFSFFSFLDFIYHLQVNPTIPKYKRSEDLSFRIESTYGVLQFLC